MPRPGSIALAIAALVVSPAAARAEPAVDCPPGAWFCAEAPGVHIAPAAPEPAAPADAPAAPATPPPAAETPAAPAARPSGPQRMRRVPHPPPPSVPPWARDRWAETFDPPPPPPARNRSELGFQVRFEGVMMGSSEQRAAKAGMGGFGFSLRPRPSPYFAIDLGLDFVGGRDFQGARRSEAALLASPMVFFNPRDRVQVYLLGGIGLSSAHVEVGPAATDYGYFGMHGGLGLEWRVTRRTGLSFDMIGFVRDRIDAGADASPEFVDPSTGRATNASGGGLARLGATFYW